MISQKQNTVMFKKIIIIFWFIWWLIALWTDFIGMFAHMGLIHKSWAPDTNYPFLVESLKMYAVPDWVPQLSFAGILIWSLLSTLAFLWTCLGLRQTESVWMKRADLAFTISISFWFALFLADQLVMKFDLEENHMVQGVIQLLTYLSLYILPSKHKDSQVI
jgi:hypothetical protein